MVLAVASALAGSAVSPAVAAQATSNVSITVTAGKPSEFSFTLSKKTVAPGAVVFRVVNAGKRPHDFVIAGKKTPTLAPGRSATLTVVFSKAGSFTYSSSVAGQAAHGMKGVLTVRPAASTTTATSTTTTSPTSSIPAAAAPPVEPCASPTATTINVAIFDFGFTLSRTTVPCGKVTFVVVNTGQVFHNFDVEVPVANGRQGFLGSKNLLGDETETQTADYTRTGLYRYQCDLHWVQGQMIGVLTVTQ